MVGKDIAFAVVSMLVSDDFDFKVFLSEEKNSRVDDLFLFGFWNDKSGEAIVVVVG